MWRYGSIFLIWSRLYTYVPKVDNPWPTKETVVGYLDDTQFYDLGKDTNRISTKFG